MPSEPKHPDGCGCPKYGCQLRSKGVQVSHKGMARHNQKPPGDNARYNNWEKGIARESRPGGTSMPLLDGRGDPVPVKKFAENRSKFEESRKKMTSTTSP